jgi:hypothetical protein
MKKSPTEVLSQAACVTGELFNFYETEHSRECLEMKHFGAPSLTSAAGDQSPVAGHPM